MSLRICDSREESKNEYALFLLACLGGIVAVCAAAMFLFTFFDVMRWNVADPEKFQSNLWIQWSAFAMIVGTIVMADAWIWKYALGYIEEIQKLATIDFGKRPFLTFLGCNFASCVCFVIANFWAPMLFVFIAIGICIASGSQFYAWRQCIVDKKRKESSAAA